MSKAFSRRQRTQNISFNPSCITRLLPEPTSGLPAATSGVAPPAPNALGPEGSMPRPDPFDAPYGLATMGLLNRLNNSTRNSAPNRSVNLKVLNTEKSTFLKPPSRKMFRPIVPNVPSLGGTMTELPFTKQPPAASVVGSGATAAHCAARDEGRVLKRPLTPDNDVHVTPLVSTPPVGVTPK